MADGPFIAFGGSRVPIASLTLSANIWVADLEFPETQPIDATSQLTVGDLALLGTVYRQSDFAGTKSARVVAGYGGWHKSVVGRAYTQPGGVKLSMVAKDLAGEVGEKVAVPNDRVIGDYFIREAGPAHRVLRQLAGRDWYVDDDGTTRIQARPSSPVGGDYLVQSFNGARGELVISTESYTEWRPGNTFSNALVTEPQTISTVRLESTNDGLLRHTILATGPDADVDRMTASLRELILSEIPQLHFLGVYSYVVIESDGQMVTGRPANSGLGIPPLVKIPLRAGVAGMRCKPKPGTLLAVGFLDSDPTQPYISGGFEQPAVSAPVVCYGDSVTVGSAVGIITSPATELLRTVRVEFP